MSERIFATRDGRSTSISESAIDGLATVLKGKLIGPDSDSYDESRALWNGMIDKRPALIVECADTHDVQRAMAFAREHDLLVAVRSGGHNIAGNAMCDGGLVISLAGMKSIRVDAAAKRAWAEPGLTLGELDAATQAHGLATPVGINSTTGIAGLTLGGGFGWISRSHGMTIDNLLSVKIVTADGELRTASANENAELFWGVRGGGGNFGVVTEFEYALHPVGPEILAGLIVHPFGDAKKVLQFYRDFAANAPDELTVWVVMRKAPPLPFLPEQVHGTEVLVLAAMYLGDIAEGEAALAPLRAFGNPIADVIGPQKFTDFQTAFDPLLAPGARNYWKSHDFLELGDDLLDVLLDHVGKLPDPQTEVFIGQMGGATNRVPQDATAYPHRDAEFIMNVHGRWDDAAKDDEVIAWCRSLFDAATPFATGGIYVNFMTADEQGRVDNAYGESMQRLVDLKSKYDPTNLFRLNQNIAPKAVTAA